MLKRPQLCGPNHGSNFTRRFILSSSETDEEQNTQIVQGITVVKHGLKKCQGEDGRHFQRETQRCSPAKVARSQCKTILSPVGGKSQFFLTLADLYVEKVY